MTEQIKQKIFRRCKELEGPLDTPCLCWTGATSDHRGYGRICYQKKLWLVHRLIYELCVGHIPPGLQVNHECYQPDCCNPLHLKLGTAQSNADDKVRHDRTSRILNREQVIEILRMVNEGWTFASLARRFGVSGETIARVAYGWNWKSVPGPRLTSSPSPPLNVRPPTYRRPIVIRKEEEAHVEQT
jgi:hypothetical protein